MTATAETIDTIERIQYDFENAEGPFSDKEELLPERAALDQIPRERYVDFLSYGVMLDYNRSAAQLWDNCLDLWSIEDGHRIDYFDPSTVAVQDLGKLQSIFTGIGFRYGNRDARGWIENSQILVDEFGGSWAQLIEESKARRGAPSLVSLLREHDFKYIKGDKLAPFYAKVIHENVTHLDNVWELEIPVDTHIRKLTSQLTPHLIEDDDQVRQFWRDVGEAHSVEPMVVDGALWIIGNQWDEWGEDYFNTVSE